MICNNKERSVFFTKSAIGGNEFRTSLLDGGIYQDFLTYCRSRPLLMMKFIQESSVFALFSTPYYSLLSFIEGWASQCTC